MTAHTLEKTERFMHQRSRLRMKKDRRYFPRWDVNKRVEYRVGDEATLYRSFIQDLTLSGAALVIHGDLSYHQPVQLKVYLSDMVNFEVQGRVVWSRVSSYRRIAGIVFKNVSERIQELIVEHSFELKEDELFIYGIKRSISRYRGVSPESHQAGFTRRIFTT